MIPHEIEAIMEDVCPISFWASQTPENPAVVTPRAIVSFAELDHRIANWQKRLSELGGSYRATMAMVAETSVDYLAAMRAVGREIGTLFPLNPRLPLDVLVKLMRQEDTKLVLSNESLAGPLRDAMGLPASRVLALDQDDSRRCLPAPSTGFQRNASPAWSNMTPNAQLYVASSGSTGAPKIVVSYLKALAENARRSNQNIPLNAWPRNCWLLSLPLYHVSGLGILFRTWREGGIIALPDPDQSLADAMTMFRPTHVSLVATQLRRLLADPSLDELLPQLNAILLGGSAIPHDLVRIAHARNLRLFKTYGLTEMGSQVTTTRPDADLDELLTSGHPLAPDTVRVSAEGEIEVQGKTLFLGYSDGGEKLFRPRTADGWFPTGDLGRFDEQGRLIVLGRRDNMFISGGENIHPEEVERALLALSGVDQAMVVSVPDPDFVAVGFAFVELRDGAAVDAQQLRDALRPALPGFKIPKHVHPWPADLAPTGIKPSRKVFQDRAVAMLSK